MKKILMRIFFGLVVIIAALIVFALTKPDTIHIERSVSIKASPIIVFSLIRDFHKWNSWSPYENLDPAMKRTFSGTEYGKGAVYTWEGNMKVGAGRMEIIDTTLSKITIKLDFSRPFEGHNTSEFIIHPDGENMKVTWAMYGPNHFLGKFMSIFMNMDKMIGNDFETGLSNLKSLAER